MAERIYLDRAGLKGVDIGLEDMAPLPRTYLLLSLLASASPALAQDVPPPCNPAKTTCLAVEGWILGQRTYSLDAEPRDLPGARVQGELRFRHWRIGARGDATGLPGEFNKDKPETFKAVEGYLAGAYDLATIPGVATAGPAAVVGIGVSVETKDGLEATMPKRITAGIGGRISWKDGWLLAVVGQHQALRGVAFMGTWQVKVSDRVANIGTVAIGSRSYFATIGLGVRFM